MKGVRDSNRTLRSGFLRSSEAFPNRPALEVGGEVWSYRRLHDRAASIAATLMRRAAADGPPLTAVFAYRSPTAFAGILGTLFLGHGYVPLNRNFPASRTRTMLERAGCRALIVDSQSAQQLDHVLDGIERPLLLLLPEVVDVRAIAERWPQHTVLGSGDLEPPEVWEPSGVSPDAIAYLLFTSGSTGVPKGVMVAHRNVVAFVDVMVNLYGPTELTVACAVYRWDRETSASQCEFGVVPIGQPLSEMSTLVVDDALMEVAEGAAGELLMTGPQLTLGYWQDANKTAAAFVVPMGLNKVYYRTGDRVRRPVGDQPLIYLGRLDHQIKIHGHRVELGEVEAALREAGIDAAVALGWPMTSSGAEGIVAFLGDRSADVEAIRERLKRRLPGYMVPSEFHVLNALPLNSNGKVDRKSLLKMLEVSV